MNEIVNFIKEILMLETTNNMPVGLCAFEYQEEETKEKPKKKSKPKRNREIRLSELME